MPTIERKNYKTYQALMSAIQKKGLETKAAKAGVRILDSDALTLDILAPVKSNYADINDWSVILKLTYGSTSFLFMADATARAEKDITADVKQTCLNSGSQQRTPHRTISVPCCPEIRCNLGRQSLRHRIRHHKQTQNANIGVYRTDLDSTVTFTSDRTDITADKSKKRRQSKNHSAAKNHRKAHALLWFFILSLPTVRRLIKELALRAFLPQSFRAAARRVSGSAGDGRALSTSSPSGCGIPSRRGADNRTIRRIRYPGSAKKCTGALFQTNPSIFYPGHSVCHQGRYQISLWTLGFIPHSAPAGCRPSPQNTLRRRIHCQPFKRQSGIFKNAKALSFEYAASFIKTHAFCPGIPGLMVRPAGLSITEPSARTFSNTHLKSGR